MSNKFIPLEKQSKRKQKEYYASRRGSWGGVNPVTRTTPDPKVYKRNKSGRRYECESEPPPGFFYLIKRIKWVKECES